MFLIDKVVSAKVEFVFLGGVLNIVQTATVTTFFTLFYISQLILELATISASRLSCQGSLHTLLAIFILCTNDFASLSLRF